MQVLRGVAKLLVLPHPFDTWECAAAAFYFSCVYDWPFYCHGQWDNESEELVQEWEAVLSLQCCSSIHKYSFTIPNDYYLEIMRRHKTNNPIYKQHYFLVFPRTKSYFVFRSVVQLVFITVKSGSGIYMGNISQPCNFSKIGQKLLKHYCSQDYQMNFISQTQF